MRDVWVGFGRTCLVILPLVHVIACSSSGSNADPPTEHQGTAAPDAGQASGASTNADSTAILDATALSSDITAGLSSDVTTSQEGRETEDADSSGATSDGSDSSTTDTQSPVACVGCMVGDQCWPTGAFEPGNPCAACLPELDRRGFSPVSGTPACDDGDPCTTNDVCTAGQCAGTAKGCDDGVTCNGVESCDAESGDCLAGVTTCARGVCDVEVDECVEACNGCLVRGLCYADGKGPVGGCFVCDPAASTTELVAAVGSPCDVVITDYCVRGGICNDQGRCERVFAPEGTLCGPNVDGADSDTTASCFEPDRCDDAGRCLQGEPLPLGDDCSENATCQGASENPVCTCSPGFASSGGGCVDIDECASNLAACDRAPDACVNDVGGYHCECSSGFVGDGQGEDGCRCERDDYSPLCQPWSMVASASLSTCAISAGALFCWGENTDSELGLGDEKHRSKPTRVGTASDWEFVARGYDHTCGIRDGSLYCWGDAAFGGLGHDGNGLYPERVGTADDWSWVSLGLGSTCGIRGAGELYCWGLNGDGQLGIGSNLYVGTPQRVTGLGGFTQVQLSFMRACALRAGSLLCWGEACQMESADRTFPEVVSENTDFTDVDLNIFGGCAVRASGEVLCWEDELVLEAASGRSDWKTVSLGSMHQCGLTHNDAAYCWGGGGAGELGAGPLVSSTDTAVPVNGFESWNAIEAGERVTYGIRDGGLYAWGTNEAGSRGTGWILGRVGSDSDWTSFSTGLSFSCGLRSSGELYCWGLVPGTGQTSEPVRLGSENDWNSIAVGAGHACGIRAAGELYCFGANDSGQLGDGTTTNSPEPVRVGTGSDWTHVAVSAVGDGAYSCGIGALGQLRCWGANTYGQLGDGTKTSRSAPVNVGGIEWTDVSLANGATCGVRAGGLYCWGDASDGKIGTAASSGTRTTPLRVGSSSSWTTVTSGFNFGCGIDAGVPRCWGSNIYGSLGTGASPLGLKTPTAATTSGTFVAVAAGTFFVCALREDGALYCWGDNDHGQVGSDDFSAPQWLPVAAAPSLSADALSAISDRACALSNGAIYCWGENSRDFSGTGEGFTPVPVANGL